LQHWSYQTGHGGRDGADVEGVIVELDAPLFPADMAEVTSQSSTVFRRAGSRVDVSSMPVIIISLRSSLLRMSTTYQNLKVFRVGPL